MMDNDRQLTIPNCPPAPPAPPRVRRHRAVHLEAMIRGERRPVHVTIDGDVVAFRPKGRHVTFTIPLAVWIGLGYQRAAEVAAADATAERRRSRTIRRLAVGGACLMLACASCEQTFIELNTDAPGDVADVVGEADGSAELLEVDADAGDDVACGAWFWIDLDGDGFGAAPPLWVECGIPAPSGYVATGGDCCDQVAAVHPGQLEWSEAPSGCDGRPRFDFDCDGAETVRWNFYDCGESPACELVAEGFDLPVPCGTGAMLTTSCVRAGASCSPASTRAAVQSCR